MQTETFEYITEIYPERELEGRLNELGAVGWELISAKWEEYPYGGRTHYQARCILKRRVAPVDAVDAIEEVESTLKALRTP